MQKRKILALLVILIVIVLGALLGCALSDRVYFSTLKLDAGEAVDIEGGQGIELPFYLYKDAWEEYKGEVLTLVHNVNNTGTGPAGLSFRLEPAYKYNIDRIQLELYVNDISDAIMLKDPQTGMEIDYQYERTDGDSFVILNFPVFDTGPGEAAEIDLWLDTGALDQNVQEGLLLLSVWIHEDSVFKIIRHVVEEQVLQINISG